ncbi:glycosyltransferase family 2 protein [Altibacter lentus]|uniref:glycosyltransferase family 2 protein n=1 Tax=Altibacter lentus TaxID=1223410 RepID=UPI00068A1609|nr:glycosyltransferase family 2 protein [Altibacter lentus]
MQAGFPKISVVTPNYNLGAFLERTITSVLDQKYPNLEYIIIDGGSTDHSLDIIARYQHKLAYFVSEPDKGMYDAINKGFSVATGDIMCWINSDDIFWEGSFTHVARLFTEHTHVQWLQGYPTVINETGEMIYKRDPVVSPEHFYTKKFLEDGRYIQQESTFWTKALWEKAGGHVSETYTLANDFELWMRFFKHATLHATRQQLGAFRVRAGQQSANAERYSKEAEACVDRYYASLPFYKKLTLWYRTHFNHNTPVTYIDP